MLAAVLDQLDYGLIVLDSRRRVTHVNEAARSQFSDGHPIEVRDGELHPRFARDSASLQEALVAASERGLRRLLGLGREGETADVSILPLDVGADGLFGILLVLGRRSICEPLSVHGFARTHGLTSAEARVLAALCDGQSPQAAAKSLGVAISTVRSQIGSLRDKTGAAGICDLVRRTAMLPPVRGVIRHASRQDGPSSPSGSLRLVS